MSDKVQLFLQLLGEFVDGIRVGHPDKQDLSEFCIPDFVQKSVTSIFISETQNNGFRSTAPAPAEGNTASAGDKKEVRGVLQKKKSDEKNGRKQYSIQLNGAWYNTLNSSVFGGYKFTEGEEVIAEVKATVKDGRTFWNLMKLTAVDNGEGDEIPF